MGPHLKPDVRRTARRVARLLCRGVFLVREEITAGLEPALYARSRVGKGAILRYFYRKRADDRRKTLASALE